ncbi:MAG: hypothetical protein KIT09_00385 [Bryobacteraceae bacterium]|nr:hypothetical protein [Bryobacteraceae bacterium]
MAVPSDTVLSHWSKLIENFQMPPLEFYSVIEQAVQRREIPNIEISRVDWSESGVFSAKREYLRVSRGRHVYDMCGAPFGTGFFVSSWFVKPEAAPWPVAVFLLSLSALVTFMLFTQIFGYLGAFPAFVILFPLLFWGLVQLLKDCEGWDDSIVAIPFLGAIYERLFRPQTYYKIDTTLMFQQAVHNALMEAVDQVTSGKGVRALSELERKPTLHFAKAAGS